MWAQLTNEVLRYAVAIAGSLLVVAAALVAARLSRGPTVADRALALDLLGFVAIAIIALVVLATGRTALFDAAMAVALVAFVATLALARLVGEARRG